VARLIYSANVSLDGYIEDESGSFEWGAPSDEVHLFFNDLVRSAGTNLYGRRLYETMAVWETDPSLAEGSEVNRDFATAWQDTDKIVYSRTLEQPSTKRTRIEREFDPEVVTRMKKSAEKDLLIGGAELAGEAFRAGLVDEVGLRLVSVAVGAGKPALPVDQRLDLELRDERRFDDGSLYLSYDVKR
jgi:dihydrofolate reductase